MTTTLIGRPPSRILVGIGESRRMASAEVPSRAPSRDRCAGILRKALEHLKRTPDRFVSARRKPYLIESYTLNIGRYIAITMNPTIPPTTTIMIGSRIEVSALTAAATWSS